MKNALYILLGIPTVVLVPYYITIFLGIDTMLDKHPPIVIIWMIGLLIIMGVVIMVMLCMAMDIGSRSLTEILLYGLGGIPTIVLLPYYITTFLGIDMGNAPVGIIWIFGLLIIMGMILVYLFYKIITSSMDSSSRY